MKKPTITIVIPAFNEASRIADCLDSIALQIDAPDRVMVVDNNCSDETVAIAQKYSFVTVIKESKQGIVHARNAGFAAVTSDVIARIDADCHLPRTWVAQVRKHFRYNRGALTGACYFHNVPCPEITAGITNFFFYRVNRITTGHYLTWGSNMAIWREDWESVQPTLCNATENHEDLDISIHLHQLNLPIVYDKSLRAYAEMKSGFTGSAQTWKYLMKWPKLQREHNQISWVISYVIAVFLYLMRWVPVYATHIQNSTARRWSALDRH